jgi:hypothetical protein
VLLCEASHNNTTTQQQTTTQTTTTQTTNTTTQQHKVLCACALSTRISYGTRALALGLFTTLVLKTAGGAKDPR